MADYKSIVPSAQNGDPKALEELYKSTGRAVYFTCLSFVKNEQDAEDLTQNTYITAFKKLKTLAQPEKFEPWIKRIAVNLCKDFLIKKGTHPAQSLDEQGYDEAVDENFLPEEYITVAEKREIVLKIIRESLSDVLYQTVIMFYFDEMSISEIAEEMNSPEGTVKYRLNAARAKIKKGVLDYEKRTDDKLCAFVGLPFLARLLIGEADSVSAPAFDVSAMLVKSAPYVPDSTAVDPNFTANTAARIGGKMLGTLKAKIIAAAAAIAVVGGGTAAAIVIANNIADSNSNSTSTRDPFSPDSHGSLGFDTPDDEPDNSGSGTDFSKSQFWFARQTWTEPPRTTFEGGILGDNRKTLDLREIDDLSAPFYSFEVLDFNSDDGDFVSNDFEDCLDSQEIIEPGGNVTIKTQFAGDGEEKPPYDGLGEIRVFNFDSEPRTVSYCFEQGWWKTVIHKNKELPDETRALGLAPELKQTAEIVDESAMLDAVKAKFGTPHYIRHASMYSGEEDMEPREALFNRAEKEFDPRYDESWHIAVKYDLIYDYGDFLMVIIVNEQIFSKTSHNTDLSYVEFWSPECWEHRRDIDPAWGGEKEEQKMFKPFSETPSKPSGSGSVEDFWIARKVWTEAPRSDFEGGILRDNRKTLDLLKIDELSAPYFSLLSPTDNKITNKFSDIWYTNKEIAANFFDDVITGYYGFGEEPPPYDGIGSIAIYNFDNIPHSAEDCLENGWWKTVIDDRSYLYETVSLGLDSSLSSNGEFESEFELIDAVVEKFGTPHYIYYPWVYNGSKNPDRRQAMYEDMESLINFDPENPMLFIQYQFVYELGSDLIMTVYITEKNNYVLDVDYVEFWSRECWENRQAVVTMDFTMDEIELFTVYEP